jgi:hypothetical protein
MHPTNSHLHQTRSTGTLPKPTLYASLELSRSTWLMTSLSPGSEKMSKHKLPVRNGAALLEQNPPRLNRKGFPDAAAI